MIGVDPIVVGSLVLLFGLVFYTAPTGERADYLFAARCRDDTVGLCPDCFPEPVDCKSFIDKIAYDRMVLPKDVADQFRQHSIRTGIKYDGLDVVLNNLNRNKSIQALRDSICEELEITDNCAIWNSENIVESLWERVLDEDRMEGAIICPPGDERVVERFLPKFHQPELLTLVLMATNSQSLMVWLGSKYNLPVPSFVYQKGFILVEKSEGEPLTKFYKSPLVLRLKIANELINAIMKFNSGLDSFRFFLTDMSPDNIVVSVQENNEVCITFTALENVIILDDVSITTTRINCGCPSTVQECYGTYTYGDMNFNSVCKILLENEHRNDTEEGFLRGARDLPEIFQIKELLNYCVHCGKPPRCEDHKTVLEKVQEVITRLLSIFYQERRIYGMISDE